MARYTLRYRGTELRLPDSACLTVGRDPVCDLRVDDGAISRRHARILVGGDGVWIEDLGSQNGVHVNRRRIDAKTRLVPGDTFFIGQTAFSVHFAAGRTAGDDTPTVTSLREATTPPPAATPGAPGAITQPLPQMNTDVVEIDPPALLFESGRAVLRDGARAVTERFSRTLQLVEELLQTGSATSARLLLGEALDLLARERVAGGLPLVTGGKARALLARWAAEIGPDPVWKARAVALDRAERRISTPPP